MLPSSGHCDAALKNRIPYNNTPDTDTYTLYISNRPQLPILPKQQDTDSANMPGLLVGEGAEFYSSVPAGHSRRWGNRWLGSLAGAVPTRDRLTTHLQRHGAHDTSPQQCSVLSVSVRYGDGLPCSWPRPTVGEIHVDGSSSSRWPFIARGLRWQGGRKLVVCAMGPAANPLIPQSQSRRPF